jgi:hypothetical protein
MVWRIVASRLRRLPRTYQSNVYGAFHIAAVAASGIVYYGKLDLGHLDIDSNTRTLSEGFPSATAWRAKQRRSRHFEQAHHVYQTMYQPYRPLYLPLYFYALQASLRHRRPFRWMYCVTAAGPRGQLPRSYTVYFPTDLIPQLFQLREEQTPDALQVNQYSSKQH